MGQYGEKHPDAEKHPVRGVLAGAAGGLVAAWMMNVFIAGPGTKLAQSLATPEDKQLEERQKNDPDATMKVADAAMVAVTGGQHMTYAQEEIGGPIVHYTFAALIGAVYGGLAEYSELPRTGLGTGFGSVLFAGADLVAVPALHLSRPLREQPRSGFANHYAAHLVYGVTTEVVRRLVRRVL